MENCLVTKLKGSVSNLNLDIFDTITLHVNSSSIIPISVANRNTTPLVMSLGGNYISASSDGGNPTNEWQTNNTTFYLLAGTYNVVIEKYQSLTTLYVDGTATENKGHINMFSLLKAEALEMLRLKCVKLVGKLTEFANFDKLANVNFASSTQPYLTGSVEALCKAIVEKNTRTSNLPLTVSSSNNGKITILDDLKFPGERSVTCSFNLSAHNFTLTQANIGLNRTYTYANGAWTYVDN